MGPVAIQNNNTSMIAWHNTVKCCIINIFSATGFLPEVPPTNRFHFGKVKKHYHST